jgi:UDP-N-acetylmuramyl pentapeptide phosphotransferase/UDP-N-acetylglucosamine-1-phosphate transferase
VDVGYLQEIYIPIAATTVPIGIAGAVITAIWLVWMVNAYNFMDGIDGLAATQAVIAGLGWMAIAHFLGLSGIYLFCGVIAAAVAAFLIHNWNPAKVFMGDVGSAFLGFTLAAIPLLVVHSSDRSDPYLAFAAVLLLWPFVFDTVLTLLFRIAGGERIWEAHRKHLYQRMVQRGYRHWAVTSIYGFGAALLTGFVILDHRNGGRFDTLIVLSTGVLALALVTLVYWKKSLT